MGDTLKTIIAIIAILTAASGYHLYTDRTYAKEAQTCEKIDKVYMLAQANSKQLNIKIESDILTNKQQRYFLFEDRYKAGSTVPDPLIKEEMKAMKNDIEKQEKKVKDIESGMIQYGITNIK